jgi:hypothetical protein
LVMCNLSPVPVRPRRALAVAVAASSSRTKAVHNKTVKEAMELQVAGRGGNKRKYALADINADIANKRLFVRKGLPPTGGSPPPHPSHQAGRGPPPSPSPWP